VRRRKRREGKGDALSAISIQIDSMLDLAGSGELEQDARRLLSTASLGALVGEAIDGCKHFRPLARHHVIRRSRSTRLRAGLSRVR
jgi:hypothetical protein